MTSISHHPRRLRAGFTLMELMVVIAIIALLASMTVMGFRYAQTAAMRNRTTAFHKAIMSGLTAYNAEYGEYPRPKRGEQVGTFSNKTYSIGSASMLYQAMSGDGDSEIELSSSVLGASNGKVEGPEIQHVMMKEMPNEISRKYTSGWILVDGFGHPFQYNAPNPNTKAAYGTASNKVDSQTINSTYDLWSFGEDDKQTSNTGLEAKKNETTNAKWIKNW